MYEREDKANGVTEHRHYLQAGGMTFALAVSRSGSGLSASSPEPKNRPTQLSYFQQDHLGSIAAVLDENGANIERMAYDSWGKRRFEDGKPDPSDSIVGKSADRGYTVHEHLDEVGVIHMNGRLYDPLIGRFMSADPLIQFPEVLQSFNRYVYVRNNPFRATDPSGFAEEYAEGFTGGTYAGPNADYSGKDGSFAGYGFSVSFDANGAISVSNVCGACSSQSNGSTSMGAELALAFAKPAALPPKEEDSDLAQPKNLQDNLMPLEGGGGGGRHSTPEVVCPGCHQERHRK